MNKELKKYFEKLLNTQGPSGFEAETQNVFKEFINKFADKITTDVNGNVVAYKKGNGKKNIMLIAHADEIGFIIKYIDEKGFIYFSGIGGIDDSILHGTRINIHHNNKIVKGVIGKKPIHLLTEEESKSFKNEDLWIDIGAKNKTEAIEIVAVGDYITYNPVIDFLPNNLVLTKSADNRVGIFIISCVLKELSKKNLNSNLFVVSSVQEEIGLRGAHTITYEINPDFGIAIDVTHATDYPTIKKEKFGDIKLNEGAVIPIGATINPQLNKLLFKAAINTNEKIQIEAIPNRTGTEANAIQITRSGIAAGLISIPCRYMHTSNEMISLNDIQAAINILVEMCMLVNDETTFIPL
jgi:endoglucanase